MKENRNWRLGIAFIVSLVALILIAVIFREIKQSVWQPPLGLTIGVIGKDKVAVLSFDPSQNEGQGLLIPGTVMLPVVGSSGQYKASALWRYGKLQGSPEEVSRRSLSYFLGLALDALIYDPAWSDGNPEPSWRWLDLLKTGGVTTLSMYDRFKLIQAWSKLRNDQRKWTDLPAALLTTETQPDGTKVQKADEDRLKVLVENRFKFRTLLEDRRTVAVANNSGVAGSARLMGRFISTAGGVVVEVGDNGSASPGWCRYNTTENNIHGVTLWLVKRLACVKDDQIPLSGRADIQVVVDQQFGEAFRHD